MLYLFSYLVMATTHTLHIPTSPSGETQTSGTDLEEVNTEDEMNTDTSKWSEKEKKKLQHMIEFHEEYQKVFGDKASLHTIIRKRIAHMNPPMPSSVCKEEMQDANIDTNEVIIEYITDAHGNKVKKLKPLFILLSLNLIKHMFNIFLVTMNFLLYQKLILHKNEKLQLNPTVNQYHLMKRQVMIEL